MDTFICRRRTKPRCAYCFSDHGPLALCDHELVVDGMIQERTCSLSMCLKHTARIPGKYPKDYCRVHRHKHGLKPYVTPVPMKDGRWIPDSRYSNRCHVCTRQTKIGERIFWVSAAHRSEVGEGNERPTSTCFCEPCAEVQLERQGLRK